MKLREQVKDLQKKLRSSEQPSPAPRRTLPEKPQLDTKEKQRLEDRIVTLEKELIHSKTQSDGQTDEIVKRERELKELRAAVCKATGVVESTLKGLGRAEPSKAGSIIDSLILGVNVLASLAGSNTTATSTNKATKRTNRTLENIINRLEGLTGSDQEIFASGSQAQDELVRRLESLIGKTIAQLNGKTELCKDLESRNQQLQHAVTLLWTQQQEATKVKTEQPICSEAPCPPRKKLKSSPKQQKPEVSKSPPEKRHNARNSKGLVKVKPEPEPTSVAVRRSKRGEPTDGQ
eukprot:Phypoly_transcript_13643.p1 GENE.Phypoly_transcript_13643~~Phypoly_transcript_13643.p1  ORF type:complete len:313 (+),score=43.67 Phypoly_transcript_13643:67-939(+)